MTCVCPSADAHLCVCLRYGVNDVDDWCACACHYDEDACDLCGWDWCEGDCVTFDARGGEVGEMSALVRPRGGKRRLTPYQKIARASERGTGVRLTADDVCALMGDTAIVYRAELDDFGVANEDDDGGEVG